MSVSITGVASLAVAWCYIQLTADDWVKACFPGRQIEVNDPIHVAVVSDSQTGHAQLLGPGHQVRDAAHAIQQAVLSMHMKVAEHKTSQRLGLMLLYLGVMMGATAQMAKAKKSLKALV